LELANFIPPESTTMTDDGLPLSELLQKSGEGDFLRSVAESVLRPLMEADAEGLSLPVATNARLADSIDAMATAYAV
jgi:hypothetical protein